MFTLDELFASYQETPVFYVAPDNEPSKPKYGKYPIYPICEYKRLLSFIKDKKIENSFSSAFDDDEEEFGIAVRYLLTTDGKLLLGEEGRANTKVPAHPQMNGQVFGEAACASAGTLFFSDAGLCTRIRPKSGHFKPSFVSQAKALRILVACEVPFADEFTIEQLRPSNGGFETSYSFTKEELLVWANQTFDDKAKQSIVNNQPQMLLQATYTLQNSSLEVLDQIASSSSSYQNPNLQTPRKPRPALGSSNSQPRLPFFNKAPRQLQLDPQDDLSSSSTCSSYSLFAHSPSSSTTSTMPSRKLDDSVMESPTKRQRTGEPSQSMF